MAEIKWIKITTDMFDNRKIKHLRKLPEGNNIVLIWVKLLTMAGRCNASGMIFLTENIPYTPKMLADELGFEESTVQMALKALEQFNMIVTDGNYFSISGWEEYQNVDRMEEIREYNRIAKQKSRAKRKLLEDVNDMSMTSQRCQDTDKNREEEKRKEEIRVDVVVKEEASDNNNPKTVENSVDSVDKFELMGGELGMGVVLLTETQRDSLLDLLGLPAFNHYVKKLATFIISKEATVSNHNQTILKWAKEDKAL